jgi:hypothetical protein
MEASKDHSLQIYGGEMTEKNRNNVGRAVSASEDFCKK